MKLSWTAALVSHRDKQKDGELSIPAMEDKQEAAMTVNLVWNTQPSKEK